MCHNRLSARAPPRSGNHFRQLSGDHSRIAHLHKSEAAWSRHPTDSGRRFNGANDISSLWNCTLNRWEDCDDCDGRDGRDGLIAAMALMALMAAVMSSTVIQDSGNRTIRREDMVGTSTESSLAGVQNKFWSTPSEKLGSTPSEEFGSTLASSDVFEAISRISQPVAQPRRDRHTVWYLDSLWEVGG